MSFIISPAAKKRTAEMAAFAGRPDNWYYPKRPGSIAPGDRPELHEVFPLFTSVTFSWTVSEDLIFRHLSMKSLRGKGRLPAPAVAYTLATWLGFTGGTEEHGVTTAPGADWGMKLNEHEETLVFIQQVPGVELGKVAQ